MEIIFNHTYFSANIQYLRKKHGLSRKKLAELIQINPYSLRMLEQGVCPCCIHIDALLRLCKALQVPDISLLNSDLRLSAQEA